MKGKKKYKYGSYIPQEQLQQINPLPQYPNGGVIDYWQQGQRPEFQYPNYQPIMTNNFGANQPIASPQSPIGGEMQLSDTATNSTGSEGLSRGMQIGQGLAQVGRMAGKFMNQAVSIGIPALNALIPDQPQRQNRYQPLAYNPHSMGVGTVYEDGGYVTKTRKAGKKGNITVTEEVPEYAPNPFLPTQPIPQREFQPVQVPPTTQSREISYERLHDQIGNEFFSPIFQGYSYGDALNTLRQLPTDFQGIPVQRSPDLFSNMWQGFYPGTQSNQWQPTELPMYDNGGNISPEKAKKILKDGKIRGKKITEKQRKYFGAMSNMNNGGYVPGQEYDLSPQEIQNLISMGYQIEY